MPTITIDKKDFLSLIGKHLSDDKLAERLAMFGTDVEKVTPKEIHLEVFPNRPDLLSQEGLARAFKNFISKPTLNLYKAKKSEYKAKIDPKVKKVRPCVAAAVIKNIKLNDATVKSLMQVQEKLHTTHGRNRKKVSIGVYNLDKIKFPLLYTTKKPDFKFIPLEYKKNMALNQILEKHPKGIDYAHLLKEFKEYPMWLDADNKVLSMPPIINSEHTKVTQRTKNLFIDATGTDQKAVEQALNIIVTSLADRNAEIHQIKINKNIYPNLRNKKIKISLSYINKILGLNLSESKFKILINKMGMDYSKGSVIIPCYRTDILHPIDIAEDIAIAYGYENFQEEIPLISTIGEEAKIEEFKRTLANLLTSSGLIETNTYHLINLQAQTKKAKANISPIEIKNPLNLEYNSLRAWMIPSLLEVLKNNKHNEYPQNIFEMGVVFTPKEKYRLAILIAHSKTTFTEAKQILDIIFRNLGLEYKIKDTSHPSFIPGRVGRISCKNKDIAYIGEISPEVLNNFGLEVPVVAIELNISTLYQLL